MKYIINIIGFCFITNLAFGQNNDCMQSYASLSNVTFTTTTSVTLQKNNAVPLPDLISALHTFRVFYSESYLYRLAGTSTWISTTSTVSGLSPGSTYEFAVLTSSNCADTFYDRFTHEITSETNYDDISQSASVAVLTVPSVPTLTSASSSNANSITLSWNSVSGTVSGYKVDISPNAGFTSFAVQDATTTSTTYTSPATLTAGTSYFYRVRSYNAGGNSAYATGSSSVITRPTKPVANAASGVSTTGFTANWQAVASATSYKLDVSTSNVFSSFVTGFNDLTVNGLSQSITGLSTGTTYYYRVRAINASGASVDSDVISQAAIPSSPTASNATSITTTAFTANWQAATGATSYRLDVSANSSFTPLLTGYSDLTVNGTSQSVVGLTPGTTYYYRVRAVNGGGTSLNSSTINQITVANAPTLQAFSSITTSSIVANWNTVTGAANYELDVATDAAFANILAGYNKLSVTGLTQTVSSLNPGVNYHFRVRAINSGGASAFSTAASTITISPAPIFSDASAITTNSFNVNWQTASGAASYRLDVSTNNTFSPLLTGYSDLTVNSTSQSVNGLAAGTIYYYRVRAVNSTGTSANSATMSSITISDPPVLQAVSDLTAQSFTINWNAATGADSYRLDVATDAGFNSLLTGFNNLIVNGTSQAVTGLTGSTNYYYRIRSVNISGTSVNAAGGPQLTVPAAPGAFTVSDQDKTSTSIKVVWQAVSGAQEYHLEVSTKLDFSTLITTYNPKVISSIITEEIVTGLTPSTIYYFRVKARNASGFSNYSAIKISGTLSSSGTNDLDIKITEPSTYPDSHSTGQLQELSISASNGSGALSVSFYHRKNSQSPYSKETTTASSGTYKVSVDNSWFDDFGMQFYFEVVDEAGQIKKTNNRMMVSAVQNPIILLKSFGKTFANYQIISIPYSINDGNKINDVFEKIMGAYNTKKWRLSQYKNGKFVDYEEGLAATSLVQGQSYFFISAAPIELSLGNSKGFGNSLNNPFTMNLKKGWNQIGNPFPYNVKWQDVLDANPGAADVAGKLYVYNQSKPDFWEEGTILNVFEGGFVFADNDISLTFPVTLPKAGSGRYDSEIATGTYDWMLPIEVAQNGLTNSLNGIGMATEAKEGKDKFDQMQPPAFFFPPQLKSMTTSEYSLSFDVVDSRDEYTWHYTVETGARGEVVLSWDKSVASMLKGQLLLVDKTNGAIVRMNDVSEYHTTSGAAISVMYSEIKKRDVYSSQLQLGKAFPNPFHSEVAIPLAFGNEETVATMITIMDATGKIVLQTNFSAESNADGLTTWKWNGQDQSGQEVAKGIFIYKVKLDNGFSNAEFVGKIIKE